VFVPLEATLERNCAGLRALAGLIEHCGTSKPRAKSRSRQARGRWVIYLDLCRVTTKARWSKDQRSFSFLMEAQSEMVI
jgi:hypothetical protein